MYIWIFKTAYDPRINKLAKTDKYSSTSLFSLCKEGFQTLRFRNHFLSDSYLIADLSVDLNP